MFLYEAYGNHDKLAKLTRLPNLATINDPERLERLVEADNAIRANATRHRPLRLKAADRQCAAAAQYRLEHSEEIR